MSIHGEKFMSSDMKDKQLLKEISYEIVVDASDATLDGVVGKLFQKMRKQVFVEINRPIIQLDANEVYFESMEVKESTEKFLFFFMPRTKKYFTVTAKMLLRVKYLDLNKEDN